MPKVTERFEGVSEFANALALGPRYLAIHMPRFLVCLAASLILATQAVAQQSAPTASGTASGDTDGVQKAMLYEEPTADAGTDAVPTSLEAAVTWRFVQDGPNGAEIEADLQ